MKRKKIDNKMTNKKKGRDGREDKSNKGSKKGAWQL
jgi:hypothetical protein